MYKKGFIKDIIIIIIAVFLLNYFGFDVKKWLDSPEVKGQIFIVWDLIKNIWINYIQGPADYLWNQIIIGVVWEFILKVIDKLK
ncbi:MAG: hypothetical protein AAB944_02135 [Patescibacteria group bacterium]